MIKTAEIRRLIAEIDKRAEEVETEKKKVIWGFYEERLPVYSHYPDVCELHEEVTADEVNKLVASLVTAETTTQKLVKLIQAFDNDLSSDCDIPERFELRRFLSTPEVKALMERASNEG